MIGNTPRRRTEQGHIISEYLVPCNIMDMYTCGLTLQNHYFCVYLDETQVLTQGVLAMQH